LNAGFMIFRRSTANFNDNVGYHLAGIGHT
jgi:hypothetical protein